MFSRHRRANLRNFLAIWMPASAAAAVHIVLDNYATPRLRHSADGLPTSITALADPCVWLNLIERWFGLLTERQIGGAPMTVAISKAANREVVPCAGTRASTLRLSRLHRQDGLGAI